MSNITVITLNKFRKWVRGLLRTRISIILRIVFYVGDCVSTLVCDQSV